MSEYRFKVGKQQFVRMHVQNYGQNSTISSFIFVSMGVLCRPAHFGSLSQKKLGLKQKFNTELQRHFTFRINFSFKLKFSLKP